MGTQQIHRTYVEDIKDPGKIPIPRSNLALIALGEDESKYRIPFTLLDNLLLDPGQSTAVENVDEYITSLGNYRSGSRSQLSNRIKDGLVELIQFSSLQFPV